MLRTICESIEWPDSICTTVTSLNMLTFSCSWEEVRCRHRQQPSPDHRAEAMLAAKHKDVLFDAVVLVVVTAMLL